MRGTSSNVPSTSSYAPQQPPPPSGHPPISTGYSSKPYSGNNKSRRGRGKVLSNLISSRATSSDFLPVTSRFLPDQQETTGGDEVEALLNSGSLAGDCISCSDSIDESTTCQPRFIQHRSQWIDQQCIHWYAK